MSKKKTAKASYASYATKGSYTANKKAKIARHLRNHPEDAQALQALKGVKGYSRKKPEKKQGWVSDTLRASLVYLPLITAKGNMINVRNIDQVPELTSKFGQALAVTRQVAQTTAQALRFSRVSPYHMVRVYDAEMESFVYRHTAKTSNFAG